MLISDDRSRYKSALWTGGQGVVLQTYARRCWFGSVPSSMKKMCSEGWAGKTGQGLMTVSPPCGVGDPGILLCQHDYISWLSKLSYLCLPNCQYLGPWKDPPKLSTRCNPWTWLLSESAPHAGLGCCTLPGAKTFATEYCSRWWRSVAVLTVWYKGSKA